MTRLTHRLVFVPFLAALVLGEEALDSPLPSKVSAPSGRAVTHKVPDKPLPGQKRPPCNNRYAVVLNDGCWWEGEGELGDPPCETGTYEHNGRCYVPLFPDAKRVPTSEEP